MTSSAAPAASWSLAHVEKTPPGVRLTAMRSGPPSGAQIEYERRTSSPPMSVRSVTCCPGSKRNSSRIFSGTSNVMAIASRVSRSTFATGSG